jgi:peptidoglycan/xylan/chitin deacetylase (PgdA/CDA1 family)
LERIAVTSGRRLSAGRAAATAVALVMLAGGTDSIAGNSPPPRDAEVASLPGPKALQHGPSKGRRIALTFDADLTGEDVRAGRTRGFYDRDIVRTLRRTDTPATLFVTGLWAREYPKAVRKLARGRLFELANHTYDHRAWTANCYGLPRVRSDSAKRREVSRTARVLRRLTGERPFWFRFPGLCHDRRRDLRIVARRGEQAVDGISSADAYQRDPDVIVSTVVREARPGAIFVLHLHGAPDAPSTSEALPRVIRKLRRRNYRLVTLSKLFRHEAG